MSATEFMMKHLMKVITLTMITYVSSICSSLSPIGGRGLENMSISPAKVMGLLQ